MSLSSSDLYAKHDRLVEMKKNTYDKLYKRCENVIRMVSNTGQLMCLFEIPSFLFGSEYPLINIRSCADYIMSKLKSTNSNIKTSFIEPNVIFIDWRRENDIKTL